MRLVAPLRVNMSWNEGLELDLLIFATLELAGDLLVVRRKLRAWPAGLGIGGLKVSAGEHAAVPVDKGDEYVASIGRNRDGLRVGCCRDEFAADAG